VDDGNCLRLQTIPDVSTGNLGLDVVRRNCAEPGREALLVDRLVRSGPRDRYAGLTEDLAGRKRLAGEVRTCTEHDLLVLNDLLREGRGLVRVTLAVLGDELELALEVAFFVRSVDRILDAVCDRLTDRCVVTRQRAHRRDRPGAVLTATLTGIGRAPAATASGRY
jgi:hypothetical protein